MDEEGEEHKKLVQLIRKIARDEAYTVLDEHLGDHEHKEKPTEHADIEAQGDS